MQLRTQRAGNWMIPRYGLGHGSLSKVAIDFLDSRACIKKHYGNYLLFNCILPVNIKFTADGFHFNAYGID